MIHIENIFISSHQFQLSHPFTAGDNIVSRRESAIIEIYSKDGHKGTGEALPLPGVSAESLEKAIHQLKFIKHEWINRVLPEKPEALCLMLEKDLDHSLFVPSVIFAVESAIVSLAASMQAISPAEYLYGASIRAGQSACLIQGNLETVRRLATKYIADNFAVFKLKVGSRDISSDVQKVEAVREIIGPHRVIRLDANAAWSLNEAVAFASAIGKANIDFIEEPCTNEKEYEKFFRRTDMPFAIEAHAVSGSIMDWEGIQGIKAIVVKPMLSGGITGFLKLKDFARQTGIRVIISSVFESAVGMRMLANLAAFTDEVCGLGPANWVGGEASSIVGEGGIILQARLFYPESVNRMHSSDDNDLSYLVVQ